MRLRRALLVATWLAGTLLATAIVYEAVNVVAGEMTGQWPQPISQASIDQALSHSGQATASQSPPQAAPTPTPSRPSPTTPPPTPPASGGPPPTQVPTNPPSNTRTFALVGGTASLTCTGSQVTLNWATPNPGFQVETGTSDGGAQIEVRFRSDTHDSRLQAWCLGGQVQGSVQEASS